jgi:protein-S-isoprenylcysteine O-methyltransferase Ste14
MLQRPQTLWILLSVITAVSSFEFPFVSFPVGSLPNESSQIDAGSSMLLILLTSLSVALSGYTILSYTNLVRQKTLCWIGIILNVALLMSFLREWRNVPQAQLTVTSLLPAINPIFLLLAWYGIDKDQKMLKKLGKRNES